MVNINGYKISEKSHPYIIAEISANHNGSLIRAKKHIKQAKESGADAVKIQTYTANTMTLNCDNEHFVVKEGIWSGRKLYELYDEAHTPFEWHEELFDYAKCIGITLFSSPFDESAVDLLDKLDVPAYKIASFELCDTPLIKYIARKNKPMLMSTGMATIEEIDDAVKAAKDNGCKELLLFHCISSYPTKLEESNLRNITFLRDRYGLQIGLSDHTLGNEASIAAVSLGASAIEKHFILSRQDKGPDSVFSIEPEELEKLKQSTSAIWNALNSEGLNRSISEESNREYRRSIYFSQDIKAGNIIDKSNIQRVRPGFGLEPKYYESIIGKTVKVDVKRGDPVKLSLININQ